MIAKAFLFALLAAASAVISYASCFDDPSSSLCADAAGFYSNTMVENDLNSLCTENPRISGCRYA
jgi:hypothetical protein